MENIKKANKSNFSESIFSVFSYILKQNNLTYLGFLVIFIIETIQIHYFSLYIIFKDYWKDKELYQIINNILQYFIIGDVFISSGSIFELIEYIFIVILLLMIVSFFYILVCLKKNYKVPSFFSSILNFIFKIYAPILFLPFISKLYF
jgi:hypothetical protein